MMCLIVNLSAQNAPLIRIVQLKLLCTDVKTDFFVVVSGPGIQKLPTVGHNP